MDAAAWLSLIDDAVRAALPNVEISRPDYDLLTFSLGTRSVVLHVVDDIGILAPSFAAGGTIGSRLQDRVQHLEMQSYATNDASARPAADAVLGHLRQA